MNDNASPFKKILANKSVLFLIVFGGIIFVVLILLPIVSLFTPQSDSPSALMSPTPAGEFRQTREFSKYDGLAKTEVGITTASEVEKNLKVLSKTTLSQDRTKY